MLYRPGLVGRMPCPSEWYPGSGAPTVDDTFMTALPSGWTLTRTSANATDCLWTDGASAGTPTTFAANAPRFLDFGLLIEPARTNLFLNSDAPATQTVTLAVGSYVLWFSGASGTVLIGAGTAATANLIAPTPGVPGSFDVTTAGTVTITVLVAPIRMQLEAGNAPTSYIASGATAQTRTEDRLGKAFAGGVLNPAEGTYWVECIANGVQALSTTLMNSGLSVSFAGAGDSNADRIMLNPQAPDNQAIVHTRSTVSIVGQSILPIGKSVNAINRIAMAVSVNRIVGAIDYSLGPSANPDYRSSSKGAVTLGGGGSGAFFNGFIRAFKYWPVAQPDNELKECTAPGYFNGPPIFDYSLMSAIPRRMVFYRGASTGVATDGYATDATGSGYNTFAATPAPRFSSRGLMMENGRTNYYPLGNAPITRTSNGLTANQGYKLWIIGAGSVTVSPGTTTADTAGNGGVATQGNPLFLQCTVTGNLTCTVAGSVTRAQIEQVGGLSVNAPVTSFIQNTTAAQTRGVENLSMAVGPWWRPEGRTYYIEVFIEALSNQGGFISVGSTDGNSREQIFQTNNTTPGNPYTFVFETQWPGNFDPSISYTPTQAHMIYKFALSTTQWRRIGAVNGVTQVAATTGQLKPQAVLATFNTGLTQLTNGFGSNAYRKITMWDYAMNEQQLATMTT